MDDGQIHHILEVSRRNNQRDQITGFLIFRDGYFLQLLEGPESKVRMCLERIHRDQRSTQITIQGELFSDERIMSDWSMAYFSAESLSPSSKDLLGLFELARMGESFSEKKSLLALIRLFAKDAQIIEA